MPQLGRYEVLKPLAKGSMADLLLARTTGMQAFERHVVIKQIRPELATDEKFVKMFLEEARLSASLHHQNIVQVYDVGEQAGAYFFAMEYVHGEDLRTIIAKVHDRNETIPLDVVCTILVNAASGLHHAHEKLGPDRQPLGLIHRDVSPSNILVGYDGSLKLVDFGLAKAALRSVQTRAGTLKGKAGYMSPEQCRGLMLDRRSDVFGLGIVLYELLTARRLFKAANDFLTMTAIVQGDVPPPSTLRGGLPRELDEIVARALAKDPAERYQTADELRAALERFMTASELRTSAKQLADYMKQLFGERPEPWLGDRARTFEHESSSDGLVEPPAQPNPKLMPRDPRSSAPLAMAQAMATGEDTRVEFVEEAATVASEPPIFAADEEPSASHSADDLARTIVAPPSETLVESTREPLDDTTTQRAPGDLAGGRGIRAGTDQDELSTNNIKLPPRNTYAAEDARTIVAPPRIPQVEAVYEGPPATPRAMAARALELATQPIGIAVIATIVLVVVALAFATCGRH